MRLIIFLCLFLTAMQGKSRADEMELVADIMSSESWFWRLSVALDNDNAYLCGAISVDNEYYLKGIIAQIDRANEQVKWEKKIEDADKTIVPQVIRVNNNSEIELLSELSLLRSDFTYGNQVVNIRKYTMGGEEIENFTDSSSYEMAIQAAYPIRYDKDFQGLSVYYTPMSHHTNAFSYAIHLDSAGHFMHSAKIDSSVVVTQDTLERYLIAGFENHEDGVYCYGRAHIKNGNSEILASYILNLDKNDQMVWKTIISPDNGYFTINDLAVLDNSNIVFVGFKGDGSSWVYNIDSKGEIIWKTQLVSDTYNANGRSIIQNLSGDFIVAGSANDKTSGSDGDYYLAKLDNEGNIRWQQKQGVPFDEYLTDIVEYEPNKYYLSGIRTTLAQLFKYEDNDVSVNDKNIAPDISIKEFADHYEVENNYSYDKAELVDIRGRVLKSFGISNKLYFTVSKDNYYRGVFFLRLTGTKASLIKKLIY